MKHLFSLNDKVALTSTPSKIGIITEVRPGSMETRYKVFHSDGEFWYYESQLTAPSQEMTRPGLLDVDTFMARLTALQLLFPGLSALYSLHAARVTSIPYQFKPVLKLIRSDRPRLLIADEVGVGKTIEAGLILRELQARRDLRSVLVLCPKALVTDRKWERELKRFDETFVHLDGPTLRYCIDEMDLEENWPDRYRKAILSLSLLNDELLQGNGGRRKGLLDLDVPPHFDLVILDEAHNIRNSDTQVHRAVRYFCDHAEAVVFLTATPIQLGAGDLFTLLTTLRPDIVRDRATFARMAEPNPFINQAIALARANRPDWEEEAGQALTDAGATDWGRAVLSKNPDYTAALAQLARPLNPSERLAFIRQAEELHTFSPIINRTRRRDIGNFTTRTPETVEVAFTPPQRQLHDDLLATQQRILAAYHSSQNIKFLMTTIRRQAASCLHGLAPFLHEILTRRDIGHLHEDFDRDAAELDDLLAGGQAIRVAIRDVLLQAERLDADDPKCAALVDRIRQKQALPNNKMLIFSAFRHTLRYLVRNIGNTGVRCGLVHGDVKDEERQDLRRRFSLPRTDPEALDVLLSSEVGCEGLDYQFCDCLVNYDIPWNPMRVEQRIGRIDRYGQKSEKVLIYNFITPGTVDADIYQRCLERIGVFHQSIGGSEEILGEIARKIQDIAEDLQLTAEERSVRLQQLADNEIRLQQEQQRLMDQQTDLFGLTMPPAQAEADVAAVTSPWLTAAALQNLVERYLERITGRSQNTLGDKPLKTLRVSQETRVALLADYERLELRTLPVYKEWNDWLKRGGPTLPITFDDTCAVNDRDVTFVTPVHPLAVQAAQVLRGHGEEYTAFRVRTTALPTGTYPFAIYQWQLRGIRPDVRFQPVCQTRAATDAFMDLLKDAEPLATDVVTLPDQQVFDDLDEQHFTLWKEAQRAHQDETHRLATYRFESLRTSHQARIEILRERATAATNDRIRRIPLGELKAAEADYARRAEDIRRIEASADIELAPVAFGVMVVEV